MIEHSQVETQLKKIKSNYSGWGSSEISQLPAVLMEGEEIAMAVNGYYEGGFGLLCATNYRVLVVDKKPFVLNIEDLRYDMITEVTYGARFIIATIHIAIPTRTIYFSSWSMNRLNAAMKYIQKHVMEARAASSISVASPEWPIIGAAATGLLPVHSMSIRSEQRLGRLIAAMRRAFRSSEHKDFVLEGSPFIGHTSSQSSINPYAKLARFRRKRFTAYDGGYSAG